MHRELPADLTPAYHGFSDADLDRKIWLGGALGFEEASIRQILPVLQANYCGTVGLEYMHINDLEERRFLQDRMEGKDAAISFTPEGKQSILDKVIHGEQWEKFLAKKYVGTKRFGLDGGESAIPALEAIIKYGGQMGVEEIDLGMAHRGRLNVLSNVMGKPYRAIFHEFAGGATNPADVGGSGDVKYHLGTSTDREFDGNKVHLCRCSPTRRTSRRSIRSCSARAGRCRPSRATRRATPSCRSCSTATRPSPDRASSPNASASPAFPATAPAGRSISSSTTRSASPPRPSSRARRPIRRTSPSRSRRRSSTSTATIPKR